MIDFRRNFVWPTGSGILGAIFLFSWEQALAWLTSKVGSEFPGTHWIYYLVLGLLLSYCLAILSWRKEARDNLLTQASRVFSGLLVFLVYARFAEILRDYLGPSGATLFALLIGAIYLLLVLTLSKRWFQLEPWYPLQIIAISTLAFFYLNSKVLGTPLSLVALASDLALGVGVVFLLWVGRSWGERIPSFFVLLLLAISATATWLNDFEIGPPGSHLETKAHRSIIFILVDTLRYDTFRRVIENSPEGQRFSRTFEGAVWFDFALASSPWTVPSMGTIMTGVHPQEHAFGSEAGSGAAHAKLSGDVQTLAEFLSRRGFATGAVVGNPHLVRSSGYTRGFDRYYSVEGRTSRYLMLGSLTSLGLLPDEPYREANSLLKQASTLAHRLARSDNFFLYVHLMDPHSPYRDHETLEPMDLVPEQGRGYEKNAADYLYSQEVRFVLHETELFVAQLRESGLLDESWLFFLSDHGEMFPSDRHPVSYLPGGKEDSGHGHALYQELLHVPLVVLPPSFLRGNQESRRDPTPVGHIDLLPTFSDILSADFPKRQFRGRSLSSLLIKPETTTGLEDHSLLFASGVIKDPNVHALISPPEKLIHYSQGQAPDEIYNLQRDPGELTNLAPSQSTKHVQLLKQIQLMLQQMKVPAQIEVDDLEGERARRLRALGYTD